MQWCSIITHVKTSQSRQSNYSNAIYLFVAVQRENWTQVVQFILKFDQNLTRHLSEFAKSMIYTPWKYFIYWCQKIDVLLNSIKKIVRHYTLTYRVIARNLKNETSSFPRTYLITLREVPCCGFTLIFAGYR